MHQSQARLCRRVVHGLMDFQKISGKTHIHIQSVPEFFQAPIMNLYLILSTPTTHPTPPHPAPNPNITPPQNFMKIPSYVLFNLLTNTNSSRKIEIKSCMVGVP